MESNIKLTSVHNKILLLMATPIIVGITLLYIIWLTAYLDLDAVKVMKDTYGLADPKYNKLYEPLSPFIDCSLNIALLLIPIIITYYIIMKFKKRYSFNKAIVLTHLFFYIIFLINFFCAGPRSTNLFTALCWYMD
jgi:hypothetical protein